MAFYVRWVDARRGISIQLKSDNSNNSWFRSPKSRLNIALNKDHCCSYIDITYWKLNNRRPWTDIHIYIVVSRLQLMQNKKEHTPNPKTPGYICNQTAPGGIVAVAASPHTISQSQRLKTASCRTVETRRSSALSR